MPPGAIRNIAPLNSTAKKKPKMVDAIAMTMNKIFANVWIFFRDY